MKKTSTMLILVLAVLLTACGQASATEAIPTVVLDAGATQANTSSSGGVSASAEVVPVKKVELSFPMTGIIQTVDVEVGDTVGVGDMLASLNTVILEAKVAEAEANFTAAETQVRYLRRVGPDDEHLQAARAEMDRMQALVDQAKAMLAQATLAAPIDGTVVAVEIARGETVVPGKVVVIIGDLTTMRIETTDLSERDVPAVKVGQPASVFIEALNESFTGKVVDVARQASTVGGDTVYKVTIELDEQPQGLLWGMSADVDIQTEQ